MELLDHLKSLNPIDPDLVFGKQYKMYLKDEYLGIGTWVNDRNVGASFQAWDGKKRNVYLPDRWEEVI